MIDPFHHIWDEWVTSPLAILYIGEPTRSLSSEHAQLPAPTVIMSTTTDYPRERKAWRYALTGQPKDVLKLETLPVPPLGDDSVLVRV